MHHGRPRNQSAGRAGQQVTSQGSSKIVDNEAATTGSGHPCEQDWNLGVGQMMKEQAGDEHIITVGQRFGDNIALEEPARQIPPPRLSTGC